MSNNRSPADRTRTKLMLVVILWRKRLVLNTSVLLPAHFASVYTGVRGRLPRLKYLIEQGVIGASEIFGVFVIRQCTPPSPPRVRIIRPLDGPNMGGFTEHRGTM
jgi:hypothetical protein